MDLERNMENKLLFMSVIIIIINTVFFFNASKPPKYACKTF